MSANVLSCELRELTSTVHGATLLFAPPGVTVTGALPGNFRTPAPGLEAADLPDGVIDQADGSADVVLGLHALERARDPAGCLREWRRVLKEDGQLVLVLRSPSAPRLPDQRQSFTPGYLVALLNLVGGFHVEQLTEIEPGVNYQMRARRQLVAEVRMPLGSVALQVARSANTAKAARAEMLFQFGSLLLQTDEAALAEQCFRRAMDHEPAGPEALFGLGMSRFVQGRYGEALTELQRAQTLRPQDPEIRRWVATAQRAEALPAGG